MSQIDWSKAPDVATHWEPESGLINASWMKLSGSQWYYWPPRSDAPAWAFTLMRRPELVDRMVARPTTPQWNGTGLPPVGARVVNADDVKGSSEVIMHRNGGVIIEQEDGVAADYLWMPRSACRPIRTPEQIAAAERDAITQQMWNVVTTDCGDIIGIQRRVCEDLYDAGYRKP